MPHRPSRPGYLVRHRTRSRRPRTASRATPPAHAPRARSRPPTVPCALRSGSRFPSPLAGEGGARAEGAGGRGGCRRPHPSLVHHFAKSTHASDSPLTFPSLRDGPLPLPQGERRMQRRNDPFQYAFEILHHFVVPESQNTKAVRFEAPRPLLLVLVGIAVLAAIDLDDQAVLEADEIDDIAFDRLLPAEFGANLMRAQCPPDPLLGLGRVTTESARDGAHRADPVTNCGFAVKLAARSITSPQRSTVASSKARPMSCNPSGRPSPERPAGTEIAGNPARLVG